MNLKTYFKPLIDYWWLLLSAAIVAMATTYVVTLPQPSIYQTQTTLIVGNMMYEANPSGNDIYLGQQLANYYAKIGMQGEVSNSTQEALGLSWLPQYTIIPLPNSQFIEIIVNDSNPARAQAVANELANQLINHSPTSNQQQGSDQQAFINEQISYLEEKIRETLLEIEIAEKNLSETNSAQKIAEAQDEITALQAKFSQMQSNYAALISNTEQGAINALSVIEPAALPTSSVGPSKLMMILIAGLVAMAIAAVAAYVLEYLDDTIKTPEEIAKLLAMPFLGTISIIKKGKGRSKPARTTKERTLAKSRKKGLKNLKKSDKPGEVKSDDALLYSSNFPQSPVSEEFRLLRINLGLASIKNPLNSILITSPSSAEGKSMIASNLAIVMAESGKKVVLLDVDFDKPKENRVLVTSNEKGLSDVLDGTLEVSDVFQQWKKNLYYINPGIAPQNSVELFNSKKISQILEQLEQISDVVIIDGPPLMVTNSLVLSSMVDGVLVVLRYGFTRRGTAQTHLTKLTQIGARVLGVVLNKTPKRRATH